MRSCPAARTRLSPDSDIRETDCATTEPEGRCLEAFSTTGDAKDCRRRLGACGDAGVTDRVLTVVGPEPLRDMAYLLRASDS